MRDWRTSREFTELPCENGARLARGMFSGGAVRGTSQASRLAFARCMFCQELWVRCRAPRLCVRVFCVEPLRGTSLGGLQPMIAQPHC